MDGTSSNKSKGLSIAIILLAIVIGFGLVIGLTQTMGAQNLNNEKTEMANYTFDENGNLLSYTGNLDEIVIPQTYSLSTTQEEKVVSSSSINSLVNQANNLGIREYTVINESGPYTDEFGNNFYQEKYSIRYKVRKAIEGDDYVVSGISNNAFNNNTRIKSVVIPETVTSIGSSAFYNCNNLVSINLPETLQSIGDMAFHNCRRLTAVDLSNNITYIGSNAFYNCDGLKTINIPQGISELHSGIFQDCDGLTEVVIPSNVRIIYSNAFYGCNSLANVVISEGVNNIESYAFYGCTSLTSIDIPTSVYYISHRAFYSCNRLQTAILRSPNYVNIDNYTFPATISQIYVDDTMFDQYMNDGMWSMYWGKIYRLSEIA